MFLKISQYSQEDTCDGVFFYKVITLKAGNFIKKRIQRRRFPVNIAKFLTLNYPSCWFFLNNSEMVKAVTVPFCSIQQLFVRDHRAKFAIPNLPQSPDIGENSVRGISNFRISGQSLINKNCHNFGTNNDIDMKLGSLTKLYKRNTEASKNRQTVTSLSFFQFMANPEQSRSRIPNL